MKSILLASAIFFSLTAGAADKALEAALQTRFNDLASAFNKNDAKLAATYFVADGSLINPTGAEARGREEIASLIQRDLDGVLKGGHSKMKLDHVRMLGNDLVLADCTQEVSGVMTPPGIPSPLKLHVAALMKKEGGKWYWQDARPYAILPPPPAFMMKK